MKLVDLNNTEDVQVETEDAEYAMRQLEALNNEAGFVKYGLFVSDVAIEGYNDAFRGVSAESNPYNDGTRECVEWLQAWHFGIRRKLERSIDEPERRVGESNGPYTINADPNNVPSAKWAPSANDVTAAVSATKLEPKVIIPSHYATASDVLNAAIDAVFPDVAKDIDGSGEAVQSNQLTPLQYAAKYGAPMSRITPEQWDAVFDEVFANDPAFASMYCENKYAVAALANARIVWKKAYNHLILLM